ncbi:MAG: TonB family protein [Candidatus Electrothrix sp. MAN1_4]|nr:TonB family protein [Candidatus Electrothrix sp. MAN1_4]
MNEAIQRMLPATALTLALHGALLSWQMELPETVPPKPPARKKISISLKRLVPPPPLKKITQEMSSPPKITSVEYEPIRPLLPVKAKPEPTKPVKKQKPLPRIQSKRVKKQIVRPQPKIISQPEPSPKPPPKVAPVKPAPVPRPPVPQPKLLKLTVQKAPSLADVAPVTWKPIQPLPAPPAKKNPVLRPQVKSIQPVVRSTPSPQPVRQVKPVLRRTTTYQRSGQPIRSKIQPTQRVQTQRIQQVQRAQPNRKILRTKQSALPIPSRTRSTRTRSKAPVKNAVQEATPLYQSNPPPAYPRMARRRGLEGIVMLGVTVLKDGSVDKVRLHKSSGYRLLDKSALKTVKKWRFSPGTKNGRPASMEVLVPVRFKLK